MSIEVILKEHVEHLGQRGEIVKVADGYGRNFLLPRKLALQATDANKAVIEQMKTAAARRSASEKIQAEQLLGKLEPVLLSFTRKSGDGGHLFGSVTSADIAAELAAKGFEVDRRKIVLNDPDRLLHKTIRELLASIDSEEEFDEAIELILEQVPEEELAAFVSELLRHGNKRARQVCEALLADAQLGEATRTSAALGDPLARERAVLNVGEHALHGLLHFVGHDLRTTRVIAILGRVGDRVAHEHHAAAIHQIDDQLQLVQTLEVGDLRRVAGLRQRLEARLHERRDAAA